MPTIGLVDDRLGMRRTLAKIISRELPAGWSCIPIAPLKDMSEYIGWISESEIGALILDEQLHEHTEDSEGHVDYNGHDLTFYLRKKLHDLPIHIVTSHGLNTDLTDNKPEFESIYDRNEFIGDKARVINFILRSASRFLETYQEELFELGELSQKSARSALNKKEKIRLIALQTKLKISIDDKSPEMASFITEIESKLIELSAKIHEFSALTKKGD